MARLLTPGTMLLVVTLGLWVAPTARAQSAPDVRNVRPVVMLLVDTSGSMERSGTCTCTTPTCDECYPVCTGTVGTDTPNRWATVVEALTGSWSNFSCTREDRNTSSFVGQFDYNYFLPHFVVPSTAQNDDGILDVYADRVKFGLMTFDGVSTFTDMGPLVPATLFASRTSDNASADGMYSYGTAKDFTFPGCATTYRLDNGARNASSPMGPLVSVGTDGVDDPQVINGNIQSALLSVRPFGATPVAGMLDDARYYFDTNTDVKQKASSTDTGDPYYACRPRYALLLTDGYPNADMRGAPYNCDTPGFTCPYDTPEAIAADLCRYDSASSACTGKLNGLFVVGFDVSDPSAIARLNDIASVGGTGSALFASDRATLVARIAAAIDAAAPGTTTRTVPAFSTTGGTTTTQEQLQFNTGFEVSDSASGAPWTGVLERQRYECNGSLVPVAQPITAADDFAKVLDSRTAPRKLLTVLPSNKNDRTLHLIGHDMGLSPVTTGVSTPSHGHHGGHGGASCSGGGGGGGSHGGGGGGGGGSSSTYSGPVETGLELQPFSIANGSLTPQMLDVSTTADRDKIIHWVEADASSSRNDKRLGDIYHSSPVISTPPPRDLPDESYNIFRQLPEVANRPSVVYVGTNDGILHCFVATDTTITSGPHAGTTLHAGDELWGFVPPILLGKLQSAMTSHQWMVDGTPIVRDVFLERLPGDIDANSWHTVLIVPLRQGGAAYEALDVTDPFNPIFMWQFAHPEMGYPYGAPAIGEVLVNAGSALEERALALLPAGTGDDMFSSSCGTSAVGTPVGCPSQGVGSPPVTQGTTNARSHQRCWSTRGRQMYFIDFGTGQLINQLDDHVFNAPVTGGISLYTGDTGTIATRAFFADADGVLWRLDMSSPNIADWDATPFHDMFWDAGALDGQPAYFPPVLTTNNQGEVVVIQATGDVDNLDSVARNRVVSLTEQLTYDATGAVTDAKAKLNWEIHLDVGQQVTGPLELFNGKVYFSTFKSSTSPTDACAYGESRIWGVQYYQDDGSHNPMPGLESTPGSGVFDALNIGPFANQVVMGVAVTQRPNCYSGSTEVDPYFGSRYVVNQTGGGNFELVANVSGGGSHATGGAVGQITRQLPAPQSYTSVQGWAGSVD